MFNITFLSHPCPMVEPSTTYKTHTRKKPHKMRLLNYRGFNWWRRGDTLFHCFQWCWLYLEVKLTTSRLKSYCLTSLACYESLDLGNVPIYFHPSTSRRIPMSRYRAVELLHILLGIAVVFTLRFHRSSQIFTYSSHCKATLMNRTPVRKHFDKSFSECSHWFIVSSLATPNDRLRLWPVLIYLQLGQDTPSVVPHLHDALVPSRGKLG